MNRAQATRYVTAAFIGVLSLFAATAWASTGACLNPSGQTVSGCSIVDQEFSGFLTPANNDFSSANVGTNYLYNPTIADQGGAGWTFGSIGIAGGSSNDNGALIYGSQWYAAPPPGGGTQVGGLQQFSGSTTAASISQEISGFTVGDDYAVSLYIAERTWPSNSAPPEPGDAIEIFLGGQILGTFTPSTNTWTPVTSGMMAATSSTMNLQFVSATLGTLSSSEVDSLLADVIVDSFGDPAPEPATLVLAGAGLVTMLTALRVRRRGAL